MLRRTSHHSTCQGRGPSPTQAGQCAVQLVVGSHLAAPALKISLETSQNGPFQGHHNLSRKKYFVDCCKTLVLSRNF